MNFQDEAVDYPQIAEKKTKIAENVRLQITLLEMRPIRLNPEQFTRIPD